MQTRKRPREEPILLRCMTPEDDPWLFTAHEVNESPSRLSGMPKRVEGLVLAKSARFISEVGRELLVPQLTSSVAVTFFQRFYMLESMLAHKPAPVAAACIFLACKVQETHKRLKDVIHTSVKVRTRGSADYPDGMELFEDSLGYVEEKMQILDKEREVLRVLNFDLTIDHPYKHLWTITKRFLGTDENQKDVTQAAWNFLNDSYSTYVHVRFDSKEIASAALVLSAKLNRYALPSGKGTNENGRRVRGWHECFNVDVQNIEEICNMLLDIYEFKNETAAMLLANGAGVFESLEDSERPPKRMKSE